MSRRATKLAVAPVEVRPVPDWRIAHMTALVHEDRLGEQWDPDRLLLLPRPGGLLTRRDACVVADCPNQVPGGPSPLCVSHAGQFARSGRSSVEDWLTTGEVHPVRRRHHEGPCAVTDASGLRCARPAHGIQRLCRGHLAMWLTGRRRGVCFDDYMARARPLESFGACAAACCYLKAVYRRTRLCEAHYGAWVEQERPEGEDFQTFLARVRQPANHKVLSLRGLPVLVRLELLHGICCRMDDQIRTGSEDMRGFVDLLRATAVASVTDIDTGRMDHDWPTDAGSSRFARYVFDRVRLAYADPGDEQRRDVWDLRVFGRSGGLDFSPIRQEWLKEAAQAWASIALGRRTESTVQHHVHALGVLAAVLATSPGGGEDPACLGRADVERFLARVRVVPAARTGQPYGSERAVGIVKNCALVIRESREMGLVPTLAPAFSFRHGDGGKVVGGDGGRALPAHVVAQLDGHLDLLRGVPGNPSGGPRPSGLGVLGDRAGEMAVLAYQLLKGTGRRVGEVVSLHLDCLSIDEHAKVVLVYDNHKAARMGRRLPLADTCLVDTIRAQQSWVVHRFPHTARDKLWLLPRPTKNVNGTVHLSQHQIHGWMRIWIDHIPRIDAGIFDETGEPVPFDRGSIFPHAFRHTWAQTLADEGVAPSVLRDLMDHRSLNTTLGYYSVGETRKREAMERMGRYTVDNRGVTRSWGAEGSRIASLREELSWVAVPMGKCSEPTNVRTGGQACPIRYQCAGCPHFESDPSYLPELSAYADDLRRERETMLAAGAAEWMVEGVTHQLKVIVGHIRNHQAALDQLPDGERAVVDEASKTLRKARQSVPVAFLRRREGDGHG